MFTATAFLRSNSPALLVLTLTATTILPAATVSYSAAGADAPAIQTTFDQFITDIGGPNNGTTAGSQPDGFRRITWDGGGAGAAATTFGIPMTNFANRGNVYTTPGTGFEISGQPLPEFGEIDASYPANFQPFSTPRLFAPLGSNVMDVLFTIPGSTTSPSLTRGFGVVFSDVDLANTTSLDFFDANDNPLGTYYAETANNGLSFLGVLFDTPIVSRVRITTGNAALGVPDSSTNDVAVMDDFVYAEPQPVPEPGTVLLLGAGVTFLVLGRRLRL